MKRIKMIKAVKRLRSIFRYINNHPLAGKHRLKAYVKFFNWQISQVLNPGERKVPFVGNTSLMVKKGMAGATGNIYTGLHEFNDMGFVVHFLRKEDLFADIGANIGSYTVLAAGYSGARTLSFEPLPETFQQLKKNIRVNKLEDKVSLHNIGLGSERTSLMFTSDFDTVNHVVLSSEIDNYSGVIKVDVFPFDAILQQGEMPALVKIDVEGFETEVLKGMSSTLADKRLKAIIIELNGSGGRYGYDEDLIHKSLLEFGFSPYLYDPFKRELKITAGHGVHNTIYLRDLDYVNNRVKNADKVSVFSEEF